MKVRCTHAGFWEGIPGFRIRDPPAAGGPVRRVPVPDAGCLGHLNSTCQNLGVQHTSAIMEERTILA